MGYTSSDGRAASGDPDAIHDNVAGEIASITAKSSPTASDLLVIEDAADSNAKKRVTIGSLPAAAPAAHASAHEAGGSDPLEVADLGTAELNAALVLAPDGAGGVSWVALSGIVRESFDNRGTPTVTGSASASGGTADFTIAAGTAYAQMQFLRVRTATGTCADATIQFFSDAARTVEIYDAENQDTSTTNGFVDRNVASLMADDGSALASSTLYGRITNNDAGAATFNVEMVLWGVA